MKSGVSGKYVRTFKEATHALPNLMPLNADYPFMISKIAARTDTSITIVGTKGQTSTLTISTKHTGVEYVSLRQKSTFEKVFGKKNKGTLFEFFPFKDDDTEVLP